MSDIRYQKRAAEPPSLKNYGVPGTAALPQLCTRLPHRSRGEGGSLFTIHYSLFTIHFSPFNRLLMWRE